MVAVAASLAAKHGLSEQSLAPKRHQSLGIQILWVEGPESHFQSTMNSLAPTSVVVLSISNLIVGDNRRRGPTAGGEEDLASVGVVPIGIPLIVGPAAITAILVSREAYGYVPRLVSLILNMVLVFLTLAVGPYIGRFTGSAGSRRGSRG
jgi:small neutral amino acid transporter SnatA (MarC family)